MINPIEHSFTDDGKKIVTAFEFLGFVFEIDPERERYVCLDLPGECMTFSQYEKLNVAISLME